MAGFRSESISLVIRDYQVGIEDWPYSGLARELHRWVEIFDVEFKLELPSYPVLRFERLRNAYATFAWFRSEVGTKDNITLNSRELNRDPALILRTLAHEMIHLWQHYHGMPGSRNYHNVEFRRKAFECGLVVTPRGCTDAHTATFADLLASRGIRFQPLAAQFPGAAKREVKMKKWSCACTNVRCATALDAECNRCGEAFRRTQARGQLPPQASDEQEPIRDR